MLDEFFMGRWGFTLEGSGAKLKFLVNKATRKLARALGSGSWDWMEKPFSLRGHVFVTKDGLRVYGVDQGVSLVITGRHESFQLDAVSGRLSRDSIFIDVGAHMGAFALRVARMVPEGLVVAVEPDPRALYGLVMNMQLNNITNMVLVPLPAYNEPGKYIQLKVSMISGHTAVTSLHDDEIEYVITIPTTTVDDIVSSLGLDRVDAIKIDVEGAEVEVLEGARKTLEEYRPLLLIEIHGEEQRMGVEKLLEGMYKFKILNVDPTMRGHIHVLAEPI